MATDEKGSSRKEGNPLAGLLGGLTDFVEKLNELAAQGQEFTKQGGFDLGKMGESQKPMRGVYGLSVRMGVGGEGPKVEPFGNIRRDKDTGEPQVDDVREPLVDVFDEEDHVMVLAEMPGVDTEDVKVDLGERTTMTLIAERGQRKYRKEVELPFAVEPETMKLSCKNGILEILVDKRSGT